MLKSSPGPAGVPGRRTGAREYHPDGQADAMAVAPHSALVRVTHRVDALSFAALLVSGVAILLVHPRLYWGETGAAGAPSLIDLPLPTVFAGQSGWGRYLHFLAAWSCVFAGALYLVAGLWSGHLRRDLLPTPAGARTLAAHVWPRRPGNDDDFAYNGRRAVRGHA
jgi:thiosulfate reductase cytochrome b subunit